MSKLMKFEHEGFRFEKYEGGNMVNVYDAAGNNFYAFTHYEIGDNQKKFQESCLERYKEIMED